MCAIFHTILRTAILEVAGSSVVQQSRHGQVMLVVTGHWEREKYAVLPRISKTIL